MGQVSERIPDTYAAMRFAGFPPSRCAAELGLDRDGQATAETLFQEVAHRPGKHAMLPRRADHFQHVCAVIDRGGRYPTLDDARRPR